MAPKKVVQAIEAAHYIVENDTDVVVGQLEALERVTYNTAAQYADFVDDLRPHVAAVGEYRETQSDIQKAEADLDKLEVAVTAIETLTKELDQWSSELQVKVDRIKST